MNISQQLAAHLRQVFFGGNWSWSDMQTHLKELDWKDALIQVEDCNSIVKLSYHIAYYLGVQIKVFEEGILDGSDKFSFAHPEISSQKDWENMIDRIWKEAEHLAKCTEAFPPEKWQEDFVDPKYGNYLRNLMGIIEHSHYHLGQIVILKKLIAARK